MPGPSRTYWLVLAIALTANAAMLVEVTANLLRTEPSGVYRLREFAVATLTSMAIFWTLLAVRRSHARQLAVMAGPVVATALLTSAVVLTVAFMLLSSFVLGEAMLSLSARQKEDARRMPASVCTLIGLSIWIGLMSATAPLRIHYAAVYSIALLLPLLAFPKHTAAALRRVGRMFVDPGPEMRATERAWLALLLALIVLHLLVVAKPEAGYDASAMHLQFGLLLAKYHVWPFDVTRYVWAVMPLGADWAFAGAHMLGGVAAARLANLSFAVIAGCLVYGLVRRYAERESALVAVCLLVSTPLAFLETASLLVEPLWIAFLLGTLFLTLEYAHNPSPVKLCALALVAGGAMQCKALTAFWLAPLLPALGIVIWRQRGWRGIDSRMWIVILAGVAIGALPYVNAWARTGNPLFPYMNAWFRSPYFDSAASFYNPLYAAPLAPWSLYDMVLASNRYIEGYDGAAGLHWLLAVPIVVVAFARRRPLAQSLCLALAGVFFVGVYTQQSYLRYVLPALVLLMIVAGWAVNDLVASPYGRVGVLLIGSLLCLLNLRFVYAAHVPNSTLCPGCAFQAKARENYVADFAPDRAVSEYLNRNLPEARVGFLMLNAPSPAGYVGYSRSANWHDVPAFRALREARSSEDVLALARRYRLTHAVFVETGTRPENDPIVAFRERYTVPVWQYAGRTVAAIPQR